MSSTVISPFLYFHQIILINISNSANIWQYWSKTGKNKYENLIGGFSWKNLITKQRQESWKFECFQFKSSQWEWFIFNNNDEDTNSNPGVRGSHQYWGIARTIEFVVAWGLICGFKMFILKIAF